MNPYDVWVILLDKYELEDIADILGRHGLTASDLEADILQFLKENPSACKDIAEEIGL